MMQFDPMISFSGFSPCLFRRQMACWKIGGGRRVSFQVVVSQCGHYFISNL